MMAADTGWSITSGDSAAQYFDDGTVTPDGSLIVAVDYRGTIDVAPNESIAGDIDILSAAEGQNGDAIVKYNPDGSLQWSTPFDVLEYDGTRGGVRVDGAQFEAGGFYVVGRIDGRVDLDPANPGTDSVVDAMGYQYGTAFAARFDGATGDLDWVYEVGATNGSGLSTYYVDHDLAVDRAGNAYFSFAASAFNTSLSANNLPLYFRGQRLDNPEGFFNQTYIATIDVDGQVDRFQRFGSFEALDDVLLTVDDRADDPSQWRVIAAASAGGKVYLGDAASLSQETTVGQRNSVLSDERGYYDSDVMMLSMSTDGVIDWTNYYEGSARQATADLTIDPTGTVFYQGYTGQWGKSTALQAPLQFDSSDANSVLDGSGGFLATFDPNGNYIASDFAGDLSDYNIVGTTDDGVLIQANGRRARAIGGLLLSETPQGNQHVISVNSQLQGTSLITHGADLTGLAVNDSGQAIAWGSFTPGERLPDGSEPTALGIDAYALSFELGEAPSLRAAERGIAFADSFETGTSSNDWNGNWTEDSQNDWFRSTQRAWEGSRAAEVDGRATDAALTSKSIDLSQYASADVSFRWYIEGGFDTGEYLAVDTWNGSEWTEFSRIKGNESTENLWSHRSLKLAAEYLTADFRIRFRAQVSSSREDANVDDVRVYGVLPSGETNQLPIADAGIGYVTDEGSPITLDGRSSNDPDGTIVNYAWDFDGDGQFDDAVGATPTFATTESGNFDIGLRVTDNTGATSTDTTSITITNVSPTADAGGSYQAEVGDNLLMSASNSFDPGQDIVRYDWDLNGDGSYESTGETVAFDTSTAGITTVGLRVTDQDGDSDTTTTSVEVTEPIQTSGPNLSHGTADVDGNWQTIELETSYTSMVVIATPRYNAGSGPGVVRIRNASGDRFDVRVDDAGTNPFRGGVHYVVVEEGIYNEPDFKLEAVKVESTQTSGKRGGWAIDSHGFQQSYTAPVVVGQIMSTNDEDWSVFWSSSNSRTSPANANALNIGKHVGEDTNTTRANETIGYLVIEATQNGMIEGLPFVAGVGSDTVRGTDNGTYEYTYDPMPNSKTVVLSSAGMDGGDGSWPVLMGDNPLPATSGTIALAVDEDQLGDSERKHTTEQVAYFVIDPPEPPMDATPTDASMEAPVVRASPDVDGDGRVTAADALRFINQLRRGEKATDIASFDTNGDGILSAADVLLVINQVAREYREPIASPAGGLEAEAVDLYFSETDD